MAKKKILLYGNSVSTESYFPSEEQRFIDTEVLEEFDILSVRSESNEKTIEVDDEDLLELEFEDGLIRIVALDQLEDEFPKDKNRGDHVPDDVISLPTYIEGDEGTSRGIIRNILKKLKVIRVDKKIVDLSAIALAKKIESQLEPSPGLYHCQNPNKLGKEAKKIDASSPILILLHGTASSTSGSFGGFYMDHVPSSAWTELQERYGDNIYAFEHATLTKSPLQNAIDLLEYMPKNAVVHLISHSRGGLVGEVLCRNLSDKADAFSENDIAVFEELKRKDDVANLKKINSLLKARNIKVEKFVRVACPASGTILASQRLDLYLTVLLNLIGMIPFLKGNPIYGYVKSFLRAFVKKKEDINTFPGLEAMIPGSPLVRVLNNPNRKINSELFVVAGDVKAHGILRSLAVLVTDAFYRTQHDFVVNTLSMFGGAQRDKTYYAFYSNKDVSHFKYFINEPSQANVAAALAQYEQKPIGFKPLSELLNDEGEIIKVRGRLNYVAPGEKEEKEAPYVYVLPGIMGSKLKQDDDAIWVNLFRLASGGMERLDIDASDVEPYALMGSAYRALLRELDKKYNVVPFPYDWRQSITESAKRLADDLEKRMATNTAQPFRIVAHSMGGLVVHTLFSNHPETWKKFSEREGSRAIFLGSPLRGSHVIPSLFVRKHKLFKVLHSIDVTNNSSDLLKIIREYPGLLELLPMDAERDYNDKTVWTQIGKHEANFVEPLKKDLENAKKLGELFKSRPIEGDNIIYIAGKDKYTPYKLEIVDNKTMLYGTSQGDSAVTWETGITEAFENKTWYMRATHGALCATKKYFPAIIDLLDTGNTRLLPKDPIVTRGDVEDVIMPEEYPIVMPSRLAVEDVIMGVTPTLEEDAPEFQISVEVCHGDLGNAEYPVAVGHHYNDPIVSAESVVDFYMKGRLSQNHDVGLYPGKIETSLVLLSDEAKFEGAVVLGLGVYGELNEGKLVRSFRHAFIDYAMSTVKVNTDCGKEEEETNKVLGITSLLIASDYSGLTIRNSIRALLRGIIEANKSLRNMSNGEAPQILNIEIIEIYKDRAINAMHELKKIINEPDFVDQINLKSSFIREVSGKRRRISASNSVNWWHRLKVEAVKKNDEESISSRLLSIINNPDTDEEIAECSKKLLLDYFANVPDSGQNPLKFVSLTDRARAEEEIKSTQRVLIDQLIEASVNTYRWDEETARTLFHLLIPNNFKDYATDNKNILLIVDGQSASYPWEILHFPSEKNYAPISTQIGLIRQLVTSEYARQINQTITDSVLIIGNPKTGSKYANLPHAKEEALAVLNIFNDQSYQVVHAIEETGISTINKLFSHNYKVVHMAGHGIVHPTDPSKTGMVLDNKTFITATEIESLPQTPEFVFINCCYLGKTGSSEVSYHKLAANVGTQFIQKGVKAVVAAGWAIDDAAALYFAENLYKYMFEGMPFGEAVKMARLATYLQYGNTNAWGAYQCYGDPYYRIVKSNKGGWADRPDYVDEDEVIVDLENLINRSEPASSRDRNNIQQKIEGLIERIPSRWMNNSEIVEKIGIVFYELDMYPEAEKYLEKLRTLPYAENSLGSLGKLANIQTKLAVRQYYESDEKLSEESKLRIANAEEIIESILTLGKTHEKLSLKGGHNKRKSLTESRKTSIVRDLKVAAASYEEAHKLLNEIEPNYYTIINWLTLERILELYDSPQKEKLKLASQELKSLRGELKKKAQSSTSFWTLTYDGAIGIYEVMEKGMTARKRKAKIKEVCANYATHWCNGGSIRKSENILGQVNFTMRILTKLQKPKSRAPKGAKGTEVEEIIEAYDALLKELENVFDLNKEKN